MYGYSAVDRAVVIFALCFGAANGLFGILYVLEVDKWVSKMVERRIRLTLAKVILGDISKPNRI